MPFQTFSMHNSTLKRSAETRSFAVASRAQFKAFESRYLRQVGILYAELDELEARIAEHEANPSSAIPWDEFKARLEKNYRL